MKPSTKLSLNVANLKRLSSADVRSALGGSGMLSAGCNNK